MDVLTDVLSALRLHNEVYGRLELTAPWGFSLQPGDHAAFLAVSRGGAWLRFDGSEPMPLASGDFVFLLGSRSFAVSSGPDVAVRPLGEQVDCQSHGGERVVRFGGGGTPASLVSGCFSFGNPESALIVRGLPRLIHVSADDEASTHWLQSTLQFMASEISMGRPGASTIVSRLADVLFVHAMRNHIDSRCPKAGASWLRALNDAQVGEALRLMHERPHGDWTVTELAGAVAMSRSAFAARFKTLVGDGPLEYLTRWRMFLASQMLREGRATMADIATQVGYLSEGAFAKAFRRHIGVPPGQYRRGVVTGG